jgi:hypothetical protein
MKRSDQLAVPCFSRYNVPAWPGVRSMPFQIPLHKHVQVSRSNTHLEQTRGLKLCIYTLYIYIHILVHYIMCIYIHTHGVYGVSTIIYLSIYLYIYISTGSPTKLRHGTILLGPKNKMVMCGLLLVWPSLCNQDAFFLFVHTHILFVGLIYGWILYSCAKINSCLHIWSIGQNCILCGPYLLVKNPYSRVYTEVS